MELNWSGVNLAEPAQSVDVDATNFRCDELIGELDASLGRRNTNRRVRRSVRAILHAIRKDNAVPTECVIQTGSHRSRVVRTRVRRTA